MRAVNSATNKLHALGLIIKVIGGGWDQGKIRHIPNKYYPAFSKITNGNGGLVKNGSDLSGSSPETRSNAGAPPASPASPQDLRVSKSENRQFSKGTPRKSCTPYSDNGMANAIASPVTADASTVSLAPAEELDVDPDDNSPREHGIITLASDIFFPGYRPFLNLDTITSGQDLSDDTLCGLDMYISELIYSENPLAGDEYDVLITRKPGAHSIVQGMPVGVWKAELQNLEPLSDSSRIKLVFEY